MDSKREMVVVGELNKWVERADFHKNAWEFAVEQAQRCIEELQGYNEPIEESIMPPERPHLTLIIGGLATQPPEGAA